MKVLILALLLFALSLATAKRLVPSEGSKESTFLSDNRVVGGKPTNPGDAKYQISLQGPYGGHLCGGAIISDRWILTAAHCVQGYDVKKLSVATGTTSLRKPGAIYYIDQYWVHCNYDKPAYANDIAAIYLSSSIRFDQYTQPIPLATKELTAGDEITLTGWGTAEPWGEPPDILQSVTLKYLKHEDCVQAWNGLRVGVGHLCTFTRVGEGSCHGDSGGPLVSKGELVALVNFGKPCAVGAPDVHAKILYFKEWIRDIQSERKNCNSS